MSRIAAMYTYPWDVSDEGLAPALDRLADLAGQNEVLLAASYHVATYFLPHNPKRRLYCGEDGMVLFQPDAKRYADLKINPRVSEVVAGPHYYEELVRAIRARGLRFGAWLVYAYNHHLARTHPDCARQDALGNRYLAQLCPAHPEVRRYFRAVTEDVVERFRPDTVHLESLSYLPFSYGFVNPKLPMEITPRDQFLMGLCFCEHCVRAAERSGLDGVRLKGAVASHLVRSLPRSPSEEDRAGVTSEWLDMAFESRLAHYLAARVETATSLYEEVSGIARRHGGDVEDAWPAPGSEAATGLHPGRKLRACDRLTISEADLGRLAEMRRPRPGGAFLLNLEPPDTTPGLLARCHSAAEAGIDGFTFYNYGLLREENLGHIGAARSAWM